MFILESMTIGIAAAIAHTSTVSMTISIAAATAHTYTESMNIGIAAAIAQSSFIASTTESAPTTGQIWPRSK